jgi:DNA-binding winged helix-turn-helix (wHTH) protein/TolB-like protein
MSHKIKHFYEFGGFRLDAETPSLWREGELVQIFPKPLEILVLLVGRRGAVVSREELLENIWQDVFVEESNITYNVSLLRKTLDENGKNRFIQTVPKRGYRFAGDIREVAENDAKAEIPAAERDLFAPVEQPETLRRYAEREEQQPPPKVPVHRRFIGIILLGLLLATGFIARWSGDQQQQKGLSGVPVTQRNIRTVAVLPLKTLTGNEHGRALSLGLSDSLISRLGSLNHFAVRPPDSSPLRDYTEEADKNPLEFGERLKVDAVLEGTVQIVENRLRVNVRLWDVRDGTQLWQGSFDETDSDFFNLQDAISTKVTQSLVSHLIEKDGAL